MSHKFRCFFRIMDVAVSSYAFIIAAILVIYMVSALVVGATSFFMDFSDILKLSTGTEHSAERNFFQQELLHSIAFTIVLIKAYRILISYSKTQHLNIKFLVEIAIIAPVVEIIFNSHGYSLELLILFVVFAAVNLVIYLYFYD